MKVGLQIVEFDWAGSPGNIAKKLAEIAGAVDEAGFSSLWTMDHLFQIESEVFDSSAEDPMLESYTTLGYLASVTSRVRIGAMVTGVIYRNPGYLIKKVTTLDVLSGGRANFGIGAAWNERESRGLGYEFPSLKERTERLEETLQIAKQMWSGEVKPYNGRHYHLEEPINNPLPISKPHPPVLVGGAGEKKTLGLVAKYADACNLFTDLGWEEISRKLDVLRRHCDDIGRPYEEIERTAMHIISREQKDASFSGLIPLCKKLSGMGFQHVIFSMPDLHDTGPVELIGREIVPEVAGF